MPPTRVVVFIDYQNVQYTARGLFWPEDPPPPRTAGHVDPVRFAELLCDLGRDRDPTRVLAGVRVYRGQPVAGRSRDNAVRFFDRQVAHWQQEDTIELRSRPLRYHRAANPDGSEYWAGREKGVDVMLALDICVGARSNSYDIAVVASADTDLIPALEDAVRVGKWVETATWQDPDQIRGPLRIRGFNLWNHYLDHSHFDLVRDDTDYLEPLP